VLGSGPAPGKVAPPTLQSATVRLMGASSYTLTVALEVAGNGASVTSSPAGTSCPTTCSASFASGQTVTLTETSLGKTAFTGWSGGCSGTAMTCAVVMSQAQNVSASFMGEATGTTGPSGTGPATCPARSYGEVPNTRWARARQAIVPNEALSMRICRYNGDNVAIVDPAHAQAVLLGKTYITRRAEIMKLGEQFNRVAPDRAVHSCPDEEIAFLVLLTYRSGHRLDVGIDLCLDVTNGSRSGWVFAPPADFPLIAELVRVTGGNPTPWESG
jgi:hypothetical protein